LVTVTPKKIKVAVVITRMDLGGAQEVALETVRRLNQSRYDAVLISGAGGRLGPAARRDLGPAYIEVASLKHPISPFYDAVAVMKLAWFFARNAVDVVHTHSSKAGMLGRAAAWLAGVPAVVHTVHGWSFHDFMGPLRRGVFICMEKVMAGATDCLVVVADSLAKRGQAEGIAEAGRYRTIRAASDLAAWRRKHSKSALLKLLGIKGKPPLVVGCVANAKRQKCPEDFVKVAAQVLKSVPGALFVYVGDGPRRRAAQELAQQLGIGSKVRFTGWHNRPEELAAGFDVFLLASLWEGLPCVFAQAMALGLPVVATQVGGAAEIVREGSTGYLCQPHDTSALADRVTALLRRPALRARLGRAARKNLNAEYEFGYMVEKTGLLYGQLLESA
jgi:glycosyltransferase involved in cell wall biosynthesis